MTLVWILFFLTAFCFAQFLVLTALDWNGGRRRARQRLERLREGSAVGTGQERTILREAARSEGERTPALEPLRRLLDAAGRPLGMGPFLALCGVSSAAGVVVGGNWLGDLRLGLPLAASGLFPLVWLLWRRSVRMKRFEAMFPEALDLLARALRAGHALSAGLHMVGEELTDPVGPEFARVSEEIRLGLDMPQALGNMSDRVDVAEMPFFVTALLIQRETGGNLAEIIDNLALVIRDRQVMHGKIKAVTAQTRWSANLLVLAPIAFGGAMTLMRPDYIAPLWETPAGRSMAGVAAVCVVLGWFVCRHVGIVKV